jgi:glycosyltransferase involved in cell wall biosynthesis
MNDITPVIITKNSEKHLAETLESLQDFRQIIVYDNGSTDSTKEIVNSFQNTKWIDGYFDGFGTTKNRAASFAETDWIFSIDGDEIVTRRLLYSISKLNLDNQNNLYKINRKNLFMGSPVKYSGWNPDWIVRIYNRKYTSFSSSLVHESVEVPENANIKKINGRLLHYAVDNVSDFLIKSANYSKFPRKNMKKYSPSIIFFRALFAFMKTFILQRGFLDGSKGLVISVGNFNGVFFKYMNYYYKDSNA